MEKPFVPETKPSPKAEEDQVLSQQPLTATTDHHEKKTDSKGNADTNILSLLLHDHQEVKQIFKTYQEATDVKEKTSIRNKLIKELVQHDECEQCVVYPLLKEKLGEQGLYDRSLQEHQELREKLYPLRCADIEKDANFDQKMKEAMDMAVSHIAMEESDIFDLLKKHLSDQELQDVGAKFKDQKSMFATRPHPNAPQEGKCAIAANITIKPFDKLQDLF